MGLFNGEGMNIADSNEAKSFSGRILTHPVKGLDVGASCYSGWDKFSASKDLPSVSQSRSRIGFEANYSYKNFYIRGEYLQGKDAQINREGWYVQSGYMVVPNKLQLLAKYDTYDPNTANDSDLSTRYIIGFTYFFNNWAKIAANYAFCEEEKGALVKNNYLSVQLQAAF